MKSFNLSYRFFDRCLHKHNPVYNRYYQEIRTFPCTMGIRLGGHPHRGCTHNLSISSLAYNHLLLYQGTEVGFQKTDVSHDFFYPYPFRSVPVSRLPETKIPHTVDRSAHPAFFRPTGDYPFHSPCRLQYSRAVTFWASVLKTASGVSPGLRNWRSALPFAMISIHSM